MVLAGPLKGLNVTNYERTNEKAAVGLSSLEPGNSSSSKAAVCRLAVTGRQLMVWIDRPPL
jgi:hypothetical protein